ncbi:MAG TPA: arylsulfotransferase family protein [Polyangiaceae bacterium]
MRRWMLLGSLVAIATVSCGESGGDDDAGTSGTAGTGGSGQAGTGNSGTAGTGTSGSAGTAAGMAGNSSGGSGAGTAGRPPTGGSAGTGTAGTGTAGTSIGGSASGAAGTGTAGSTGGTGATTSCETEITISSSTVSEKIATVGIVEWATTVAGATAARIDFGRDTTYEYSAPVTTLAASNRTLLLGMKQDTTYHYRIVVTSPAGECAGPDQTIMTGFLASGLPVLDIETTDASKLYGGFLITGQYSRAGTAGSPAYIIDKDGDFVWAYLLPHDVTGVRPSYDGQYMWINSAHVPEMANGAHVHRLTMDGLMDEDLSMKFVGQNHQMTVLPDETVAFYAYPESGNCDDVKEYDPATGMVKLVTNSQTAHGASGPCHLNAIEYFPPEDGAPDGGYLFSDLQNNNITKIKRSGEVIWVMGGETNQFMGMGTTWTNQHGIDYIGPDRFVFFNNDANPNNSKAIEMLLDLDAMTGERAWTFDTGEKNAIMGDVQRLENGNTIVACSTQGVLQEVGADGTVIEEITFPSNGQYGYIQKRKTLYGPPPR